MCQLMIYIRRRKVELVTAGYQIFVQSWQSTADQTSTIDTAKSLASEFAYGNTVA